MGIQSIRCAIPCCARAEEEQTTCSLITRITVAILGCIASLVGILALSGIPGLNALGTVGGAILTVIGGLILMASLYLRCVKKRRIEGEPQRTTQNNFDYVDHRTGYHASRGSSTDHTGKTATHRGSYGSYEVNNQQVFQATSTASQQTNTLSEPANDLVKHLNSLKDASNRKLEESEADYRTAEERTKFGSKLQLLHKKIISIFSSLNDPKQPNEIEDLKKELSVCQQTLEVLKKELDQLGENFKLLNINPERSTLRQIEIFITLTSQRMSG